MNLSDSLLALVLQYTVIVVPASMFIGGVGIPLPNSMISIVLGTLVQQQLLRLQDLTWLVILPTILGDILSFVLAKKVIQSPQWAHIFTRWRLTSAGNERERAHQFFARFGHWSIFLSRFAITPLAVPINILAASTGYSLKKFVLMDALGELIWVTLYSGIGYYFGLYWQTMYQLLNNFIGLLSMITVAGVLLAIQNTRRRRARKKARLNSGLEATNTA